MKISRNKIYIFFVLIAVILSIIIGYQRSKLEENFNRIDITMSMNKIRELSFTEIYDIKELLKKVKSAGISSIAIHEDTIETLSGQGKIAFLNTNDLAKLNIINAENITESNFIAPGELMVKCKDYTLFKRMEKYFKLYLGENIVREGIENSNHYTLILRGDAENLVKYGLGFSEEDITLVHDMGFNLILRPKNPTKITNEIIKEKTSSLSQIKNVSMIIFDEEETLGYPSDTMLREVAEFLKNNNYPFGMIEFASQKGIHSIAAGNSKLAVRVHSITENEMEKISIKTAIDRWLRAAQERNIRLFYLNPFLNTREEETVQYNIDYIKKIADELLSNNYAIGKASLFPRYEISSFNIFIISLGILAAGMLLLMEIFNINKHYELILLMIGFIFIIIINLLTGKIFLIKILALSSALIFPGLSILRNKRYLLNLSYNKQCNYVQNNNKIKACTYAGLFKKILFGITSVMLISVVGGLIVGALLTHHQFILGIQLFSGIKIAYIFPLIFVIFYLWWESKENKLRLIKDFKQPILFEHAFLIFLFLIFVVIYVARSGNFSFLPVPDIEEKMRLFLENYLIARPRSKEFLIGYPLLSLAIAMNYLDISYLKLPIIVMGTVAPVTIVNTYCHVHTSLSFSLLRTFNGYWLGMLFGIIIASILYFILYIYRKWSNVNAKKES